MKIGKPGVIITSQDFQRTSDIITIAQLMSIRKNGGKISIRDLKRDLAIMKTALRLIMEHGWIQGRGGNLEVGMCFRGAMRAAVEEAYSVHKDWSHVWHPMTWAYILQRIAPFETIPDWNDAKERTEAEVIALYRATIEHIEDALGIDHSSHMLEAVTT